MDTFDNKTEIDRIYKELSVRADELYLFVNKYSEYINEPRDYGTCEMIGMVEVHILTIIADHPGATITEVAGYWGRTLSAVSQTVTKLEKKSLIIRKKTKENAKRVNLYVTEQGERLVLAHKTYDIMDILQTKQDILRHCTTEEFDTFYKVLHIYNNLFVE